MAAVCPAGPDPMITYTTRPSNELRSTKKNQHVENKFALTTFECIFLLLSFFFGGTTGGIFGFQVEVEGVDVDELVEYPNASDG